MPTSVLYHAYLRAYIEAMAKVSAPNCPAGELAAAAALGWSDVSRGREPRDARDVEATVQALTGD